MHVFLSSAVFFSKSTFQKNSFKNTIRVSKRLDTDQAQCYFGPDLGPNCLQELSADDTRRQRVKKYDIVLEAYLNLKKWVYFFINTVKSLYSVILEVQIYGCNFIKKSSYFSYDNKEQFKYRKQAMTMIYPVCVKMK